MYIVEATLDGMIETIYIEFKSIATGCSQCNKMMRKERSRVLIGGRLVLQSVLGASHLSISSTSNMEQNLTLRP